MNGTYAFWHGWQGGRVFLGRLLWCTLAWWLLSGGAADSWTVGVPVIVIAAAFSACLLPPMPVSPWGAIRFAAFFAVSSLRGAVDVSWRALHWRLPLDPGMLEYQVQRDSPLAVVSLANTTSLLPGTLVADVTEHRLLVHALDVQRDVTDGVAEAERRVASLFRLPDSPSGGSRP